MFLSRSETGDCLQTNHYKQRLEKRQISGKTHSPLFSVFQQISEQYCRPTAAQFSLLDCLPHCAHLPLFFLWYKWGKLRHLQSASSCVMEHNQNYEFEKREVFKQGTTHILFSHTQELLVPKGILYEKWVSTFFKFTMLKLFISLYIRSLAKVWSEKDLW